LTSGRPEASYLSSSTEVIACRQKSPRLAVDTPDPARSWSRHPAGRRISFRQGGIRNTQISPASPTAARIAQRPATALHARTTPWQRRRESVSGQDHAGIAPDSAAASGDSLSLDQPPRTCLHRQEHWQSIVFPCAVWFQDPRSGIAAHPGSRRSIARSRRRTRDTGTYVTNVRPAKPALRIVKP